MPKVKKNQLLSNKTGLKGSRKITKLVLSSAQLSEQCGRGLYSYWGVFSLSHRVISQIYVNSNIFKASTIYC